MASFPDTLLWWKIYSHLEKNPKLLMLDELKRGRESAHLSIEQVILLNLKSYVYNSTFLIESLDEGVKYLIKVFKSFLKFIKYSVRNSLTKSQKIRILRRVPWRELNSIFWIMTQCKVYTSFDGMRWSGARREEDPFFIASNSSIIRFKIDGESPLLLCLKRVERFIRNRENFSRDDTNFILTEFDSDSDSDSDSFSNIFSFFL
jgi:hypothetical protein